MIIWKGLGFLGALIPLLFIVLHNSFFGSETVGWAVMTSAIPVWLLGRNYYRRPAEMVTDPKTSQQVLYKPEHDLFWVELDYWAIIIFLFGIVSFFPDSSRDTATQWVIYLTGLIILGRIGYRFYQKYVKNETAVDTGLFKESESPIASQNNKGDKLSRFAEKSNNKKKLNKTKSPTTTINKDSGLPPSALKKKAYYAQMRKEREIPKKFATSDHSNYFPGSMPFIPKTSIMNKNTTTEEE